MLTSPIGTSATLYPAHGQLRALVVAVFLIGGAVATRAAAAAVDWRLLGEWSGSGQFAGCVISFASDGGYVIAQDGVPAGFGSYAVDGRQILLFPGGAGEYPERGAYGFAGPDRLFVMTQNFGRSEWQRLSPFRASDSNQGFEYDDSDAEAKSSFEKAVEQLEKLSASLEDVERKLDGEAARSDEKDAVSESGGRKRSIFDRMKDAARKTAGTAGNLSRKAARSVKAAGHAWRGEDDAKDADAKSDADTGPDSSTSTAEGEAVPGGLNPMFGGTSPAADAATVHPGLGGGIGAAAPSGASMPVAPVFGALPGPVIVDVALAQRATQLAAKWKSDASLLEIVAQLGPDGSANVATSPQAVALWFVSAGAPDEGLKLTLAPDGSFVTAPGPRPAGDRAAAPAAFIASSLAVSSAREAGLRGEAFSAAFRTVRGADGGLRFGWILAPVDGAAGGGGEIVIDAVTGQPLR